MRINKDGITVDCEHCVYNSSDDRAAFDITVPIIDSETGISGPAKLHCLVTPDRHTVELLEWNRVDPDPIQSKERLQERVSAILTFVADRKICGNRRMCPSKVIQIVEENSTT